MGKLNTDQIFGDFTENCLGVISVTVLMFLKSYLIFRDILRYLGMKYYVWDLLKNNPDLGMCVVGRDRKDWPCVAKCWILSSGYMGCHYTIHFPTYIQKIPQ